ncbi:MAG TPA: hypothetical protein VMW17_16800 [Candidatus Binatia bacterium]|nr:hypothetical protein [Candidatus Binatia bacterium]
MPSLDTQLTPQTHSGGGGGGRHVQSPTGELGFGWHTPVIPVDSKKHALPHTHGGGGGGWHVHAPEVEVVSGWQTPTLPGLVTQFSPQTHCGGAGGGWHVQSPAAEFGFGWQTPALPAVSRTHAAPHIHGNGAGVAVGGSGRHSQNPPAIPSTGRHRPGPVGSWQLAKHGQAGLVAVGRGVSVGRGVAVAGTG